MGSLCRPCDFQLNAYQDLVASQHYGYPFWGPNNKDYRMLGPGYVGIPLLRETTIRG